MYNLIIKCLWGVWLLRVYISKMYGIFYIYVLYGDWIINTHKDYIVNKRNSNICDPWCRGHRLGKDTKTIEESLMHYLHAYISNVYFVLVNFSSQLKKLNKSICALIWKDIYKSANRLPEIRVCWNKDVHLNILITYDLSVFDS